MTSRSDLEARIREHAWFHTIDLGGGVVTPGQSDNPVLAAPGVLPDVRGKSVLDIGAWDGKYSFEAERAGASRVVALDHYIWKLDLLARAAYYQQCEADGLIPDPEMIDHGFLTADDLPGKAGFDLAHEYLGSQVEAVVDDFMTMDLDRLGRFDVVYYFGVLYHMVDPVGALRRLRQVTDGVAVVETASIIVRDHPADSLVYFYAGNELNYDYGNWFVPTERALHGMCRAAGFRRVETVAGGVLPESAPPVHHDRTVVHAST